MGAWGTAIFSDDTAADVRDAFTDLVSEGMTPAKATRELMVDCRDILDDADEAIVFWLALAATQWKLGRLQKNVCTKALRIIERGDDLRRWESNTASEIRQRAKHLEKLRTQLRSPMPEPRKIRRETKSSTDLKAGDVILYRLDHETTVRLCVVNLWGDRGGTYVSACMLGRFDGEPFTKQSISLEDTFGLHFTFLSREPQELITIERRRVKLPPLNTKTYRAWNEARVERRSCTWKEYPDILRKLLPKEMRRNFSS
jgi:hypothetical protein